MAISYVNGASYTSGATNGGSTTASVTWPTVQADDRAIFAITRSATVDPSTAPSGFTLLQKVVISTTQAVWVYHKNCVGNEGGGTLSAVWAASQYMNAALVIYRGVDTVNPFDVTTVTSTKTTASTTLTYPSITTSSANDWLVLVGGTRPSTTNTSITHGTVTGSTERFDLTTSRGSGGATNVGLQVSDETTTTPGTIAPGTSTLSTSSTDIAYTIALRPTAIVGSATTTPIPAELPVTGIAAMAADGSASKSASADDIITPADFAPVSAGFVTDFGDAADIITAADFAPTATLGAVTKTIDATNITQTPTVAAVGAMVNFQSATNITQSPVTASSGFVTDTGSGVSTVTSPATASAGTVTDLGTANVTFDVVTTAAAGAVLKSTTATMSTSPTTASTSTASKFADSPGITTNPMWGSTTQTRTQFGDADPVITHAEDFTISVVSSPTRVASVSISSESSLYVQAAAYPNYKAGASNSSAGTNGGTSTATFTFPTVASGDVAVVILSKANTSAVTPPSGWTAIGTAQTFGTYQGHAYYRVLAGTESGTTATFTLGTAAIWAIGCAIYDNASPTTPVVATNQSAKTTSSTSFTPPSIASGLASSELMVSLVASGVASGGAATHTAPSGETERLDNGSARANDTNQSIAVFDGMKTSPESTSWTATSGTTSVSTTNAMFTIALKPQVVVYQGAAAFSADSNLTVDDTVLAYGTAVDITQTPTVLSTGTITDTGNALNITQTPSVAAASTTNHIATATNITQSPTVDAALGANTKTTSFSASTSPSVAAAASKTIPSDATNITQTPATAAAGTVTDTGTALLTTSPTTDSALGAKVITTSATLTITPSVASDGNATKSIGAVGITSNPVWVSGIVPLRQGFSDGITTSPVTAAASTVNHIATATTITQTPSIALATSTGQKFGTGNLTTSLSIAGSGSAAKSDDMLFEDPVAPTITAAGSASKFGDAATTTTSPATEAAGFVTDSGAASVATIPTTAASSTATKFGAALTTTTSTTTAASGSAVKYGDAAFSSALITSGAGTATKFGAADLTTALNTSASGFVTDSEASLAVAPVVTVASSSTATKFGSAALTTGLTTASAGYVTDLGDAPITTTPTTASAAGGTLKFGSFAPTLSLSIVAALGAKFITGNAAATSFGYAITAAGRVTKPATATNITQSPSTASAGTVTDFGVANLYVYPYTSSDATTESPGGVAPRFDLNTSAELSIIEKSADAAPTEFLFEHTVNSIQHLFNTAVQYYIPNTAEAAGHLTDFGVTGTSTSPTTGAGLGVVTKTDSAEASLGLATAASGSVIKGGSAHLTTALTPSDSDTSVSKFGQSITVGYVATTAQASGNISGSFEAVLDATSSAAAGALQKSTGASTVDATPQTSGTAFRVLYSDSPGISVVTATSVSPHVVRVGLASTSDARPITTTALGGRTRNGTAVPVALAGSTSASPGAAQRIASYVAGLQLQTQSGGVLGNAANAQAYLVAEATTSAEAKDLLSIAGWGVPV